MENSFFLSKRNTSIVKGFAITFVVISHITRIFTNVNLQFLNPLGYFGVGLFLFISGYGLEVSFKNSGLNNFFKKRLIKILPTLTITTIIITILDFFLIREKHFIFTIILNCIGLNNSISSVTWYIMYIYVWYILFYLINRFIKSEKNKNILFLFSLLGVYIVSISVSKNNSINYWGLNIFNFYAGVFWAKKMCLIEDNTKESLDKQKYTQNKTIKIILITFIIAFFVYYIILGNPKILILRNIYKSVLSLLFTMISIYIIKYIKLDNDIGAFMEKVGVISYEIYLIHAPFILKYWGIFKDGNNLIKLIIFILLTLPIAKVLNKFTNYLSKKSA